MARRRTDPYLNQAQLESSLQIDPQIQALSALLAGKRSDYIQTRRVNASNARGIGEAANRAALQTAQTYGGDVANPAAGSLLAALKGSANTPEGQAAYNRVAGEMAQSVAGFQGQAAQAEAGRQYGNQQARTEYMSAKDQINGSYQDLLAQGGKLTAATYGKLLEARRQRATTRRGQDVTAANATASRTQSERNSVRSSGINPDTGLPIPGGKLDPKAKAPKKAVGWKEAPAGQYQTVSQQINYFKSWADRYKKANKDRSLASQTFIAGVPGDSKTGRPPIAAAKDALYVTAALDVAYDGHLSRRTQQMLNQRGIRVSKLNLPTYGQWKKAVGSQPKHAGPLNPAGGILNALGG